MKAREIAPDIYWIGVIDWAVRDFHGYTTLNGTTYNNYLIKDRDITLVDTVKHSFADEGMANLAALVDPSTVKNLVVNHIEDDHMGALARFMELMPKATLYITEKGKSGMERFFETSGWNVKVVKTGDELKTGKYTLTFVETPMLHWPDSMMTYVKEAELLISQDAFGQHLASSARFDDEFVNCASLSELDEAVIDYYANILMPFNTLIKTKIAEIGKLGIPIKTIAPDHGIIWRSNPNKIIQTYLDLAGGKADLRVAVIYDTMWGSTDHMARGILEGIEEEGVSSKLVKLRATPTSVATKELWKSRGYIVGSPTLNNGIFPSVAEFVTNLRGLRPRDRIAGGFGSFGWSGGAVKWLYEQFEAMKLETVGPCLELRYKVLKEDKEKCLEFGRDFARKVKEYHKKFE
ncbi:MAG: FprA family A-type flavoprotein [Candidatus Eiseniibacteriota bacterium]|nr:MAG: FprA family A-type flavoprotein [Candidatus Eisenbacteria bacterium]